MFLHSTRLRHYYSLPPTRCPFLRGTGICETRRPCRQIPFSAPRTRSVIQHPRTKALLFPGLAWPASALYHHGMYSCGAPFTRPIPACLVLPCPPLSACFCRLCGRKSPKNPLAAVPAVHIDHSLSFPSTFFLYPLAGSRKKKHTKHKEENLPIQVAGPLQKSLMMGTGHETLDVLRSGLLCPWLQGRVPL